MTLQQYHDLFRFTDREIAAKLGCSRVYVFQMRRKGRVPSAKMMERIKKITHGAVMPNDFFKG